MTSGLWPVLHLRSFEAVTGHKRDAWLVRTMGALIASVGVALFVGARERRARSLKILGIASAGTLAAADLYYVATGEVSRVYLADAAAEAAAIGLWIIDG